MGCQAAHQLEKIKARIDRLMGEVGTVESTPFDWLILPPHAAASMLNSNEFFPQTADELEYIGKERRFYWPRHGMWFWHMIGGLEAFEDHKSKFAYMQRRPEIYRDLEVLAIWANTQANLSEVPLGHPLDLTARRSVLNELQSALDRYFAKSSLFTVVRSDRLNAEDPLPETSFSIYAGEDAPKNWHGSSPAWKLAMAEALEKTGFAARVGSPEKARR
ncbi:MAG: hypothetical protein MK180_06545 [Rhodobacteraceae bacterium]|nr:hypothetical protein [Paracoccaceae bacterium]